MLEFVSVTSADVAEDASGDELQGTERGDFVIVIETTDHRDHLHLRRGMSAQDVAGGLRAMADCLEMNE